MIPGARSGGPYGRRDEPVRVWGNREKTTPQPSTADLLAQLIARVDAAEAAAEAAAAARHAEVLEKLAALDARVRRAEDSADCAAAAVSESEGRVRGWLHQVFNTVEDLADELLGDAPEDTNPLLPPVD